MSEEGTPIQMGFEVSGLQPRNLNFDQIITLGKSIEQLAVFREVSVGKTALFIDHTTENDAIVVFDRSSGKPQPKSPTELLALKAEKHFALVILLMPPLSSQEPKQAAELIQTAGYRLNRTESILIVLEQKSEQKTIIKQRSQLLRANHHLVNPRVFESPSGLEKYIVWTTRTKKKHEPVDLTSTYKGGIALKSAGKTAENDYREAGYDVVSSEEIDKRVRATRNPRDVLGKKRAGFGTTVKSKYPFGETARIDKTGNWKTIEDLRPPSENEPEDPHEPIDWDSKGKYVMNPFAIRFGKIIPRSLGDTYSEDCGCSYQVRLVKWPTQNGEVKTRVGVCNWRCADHQYKE